MTKHIEPVEPVTAWSVTSPFSNSQFLLAAIVRRTRAEVQERVGELWRHEIDGETWRQGWKRAYRAGYRAVRVEIRVKEEG